MAGPRFDAGLELEYVNNTDSVAKLMEWLRNDRNRSCIGIDVETTGLSWNRPGDDLRLVQIGDRNAGFAIPWHRWGGVFMECLDKWDGPIVLHNMQFDIKFLERYADWKVPWKQMHDTMIMAKIMRPGKPAKLKPLATQFVDPNANFMQGQLQKAFDDNGWDWDTVPLDLPAYHIYGALDPVETAYLYDHFRADLAYPEVYDLEMAYLKAAHGMEKRGFRVDVEYAAKAEQKLHDFVVQSQEWARANYNGIGIGSGPQLIQYFGKLDGELLARHEKHEINFGITGETPECDALCGGVKVTETTPKGAPSMNADQLKIFLRHPDPRVSQLAKVTYDSRRASKTAGTYFKAIREKNVDGRIHFGINTLEAITSRSSVSNPSMQNLPSNSSVVKNAYIPEDEHVLLSHDADQVEFRIVSCLSEEQGLIDMFHKMDAEGGDAFTTIMRDIYGDANLQKSDPRRSLVKGVIYGKSYGAGLEKMAETAGVPVEQMEPVVTAFDKQYPRMKAYANELTRTVEQRYRQEGEAYIITPTTGRRLVVDRDKAYRGTNYTIQGSAADIMKQAVVRMEAAGLSENLRIPVHDEIIVDAPREDWEEIAETVNECMTVREGWAIPLTAEGSGPLNRWGDKYADEGGH